MGLSKTQRAWRAKKLKQLEQSYQGELERTLSSQFTKGYLAGQANEKARNEESLQKRITAHELKVWHLHGAAMLVKTLHEQLRLAGVPEWNPRRD